MRETMEIKEEIKKEHIESSNNEINEKNNDAVFRSEKISHWIRKAGPNKIILAALIAVVFVITIGVGISNSQLHKEVSEKSESLIKLENELSYTQDQLDTINQRYEEAKSRIEELSKLEDQQEVIDQLNGQVSDLQSQLGTAQTQAAEAQSQLEAAQTQIAELQSQVESLQKQLSSSQSVGSTTVSGGGQFNVGGSGSANSATVFWVAGGEVYHSTSSCPTLARSTKIYSGTIAESGKSRACKVCS